MTSFDGGNQVWYYDTNVGCEIDALVVVFGFGVGGTSEGGFVSNVSFVLWDRFEGEGRWGSGGNVTLFSGLHVVEVFLGLVRVLGIGRGCRVIKYHCVVQHLDQDFIAWDFLLADSGKGWGVPHALEVLEASRYLGGLRGLYTWIGVRILVGWSARADWSARVRLGAQVGSQTMNRVGRPVDWCRLEDPWR